jgi:hypothetical protein
VVSRVHAVEHERREFSDEVGWCFPYVCLVAVRDCDVSKGIKGQIPRGLRCACRHSLSIWTESGSEDFCLEVDVMQHSSLSEMHKQCSSI